MTDTEYRHVFRVGVACCFISYGTFSIFARQTKHALVLRKADKTRSGCWIIDTIPYGIVSMVGCMLFQYLCGTSKQVLRMRSKK